MRTGTERGPAGPLFYFWKHKEIYSTMSKPFLTYEEQIEKLVKEKFLVVGNRELVEEKLKQIGYFSLIGGYKHPFRNPMTRVYINNTTFEDILALYEFDKQLRQLFFQYICQFEKQVSNSVSYAFCEHYGEQQNEYLNVYNYNYSQQNQGGINKLIGKLNWLVYHSTEYDYISYQRNTYNNIPLWVLINALTFGQVSKMYSLLPQQVQSKVSKNFKYVNEKELEQYLKVLLLYRNVCAHNEGLFSHRVYSEIPDTLLHKKLSISKNGNQYMQGKKDLFSVVIALRYLLPGEDFLIFKKRLLSVIAKYLKSSNRLSEVELLHYMGFPVNWKDITKYKM